MSVDLEDYYVGLPFSRWGKYESRVEKVTRPILDLFEKYNVTATFFTVGYVAEKHPTLIEEVKSKGHEIASHGYLHPDLKKISESDFEADLVKSLEILRKVSGGQKIIGFRAPYFSIARQNFWAFNVMRKYLRYDSSLFPVKFHYGLSEAPRYYYTMSKDNPLEEDFNGGGFTEVPMTTIKLPFVGNFPIAGGHYMRFLPTYILKAAIKKSNKAGYPFVFYIHPHDLDKDTPRTDGSAWHNYWGLSKAASKFKSILENFKFSSMQEALSL